MSGEVERGALETDPWYVDAPQEQDGPLGDPVEDGYSEARGKQREGWCYAAMDRIQKSTDLLLRHLVFGTRYAQESGRSESVVLLVDRVQHLRRELGQVESLLARQVGRDDMAPREGLLPDGRRYEVLRGSERKAWDHASWKKAVRQQVLSGVPQRLVDPETGESVDVNALLEAVQEVHGSTGPRVGQVKALGLDPDEFCERVPGSWSVRVYGDEA